LVITNWFVGVVASRSANDSTSCAHGEERDRANDDRTEKEFWKLGDIFHSSSVVVPRPTAARPVGRMPRRLSPVSSTTNTSTSPQRSAAPRSGRQNLTYSTNSAG